MWFTSSGRLFLNKIGSTCWCASSSCRWVFCYGPTRAKLPKSTRGLHQYTDIRSNKRKEWQYSRFSKQEFWMKKNKCDIVFDSGSFCCTNWKPKDASDEICRYYHSHMQIKRWKISFSTERIEKWFWEK